MMHFICSFRGANRSTLMLAGSCLAALTLLCMPALAQQTAPNASDAEQVNDNSIEDIVVTARYVAENIQDTPIAITAQTGAQLEAANVTNIGTLGAVVPNLQTVPGDSQSAGTPRVSLRGVQQGASSSIAIPPAVAIYTDDVYHSTTAGSELDFTDVIRVEVNRGPQSTLSGNASIAGSIKLFTQDPKGDGSGYVSLGYGSRKHMEAAGAIDFALMPTLAVRVLGHFDRQQGYGNRLDFACMMDKLGTPTLKGTLPYVQPDSAKKDCILGHTGGGKTAVGQIKLLWTPTDSIKLLVTARHRKEELEDLAEVTLAYPVACVRPVTGYPNGIGPQPCTGSTAPAAGAQVYHLATFNTFGVILGPQFVTPARNGGIYDTYATNCRPVLNKTGVVGTSTFPAGYPDGFCNAQGTFADHTSVSAKLNASLSESINMTAIGAYTIYSNEFSKGTDLSPLGVGASKFANDDEMWSGELRFDGRLLNDKLQWVLGGFIVKTDGYQNNALTSTNTFQYSSVHGINESQSAFAHFDYNLSHAWRVSGGGRFSHNEIAITMFNTPLLPVNVSSTSSENRWDWLISTDYKLSDDMLLYASAASGSRPAGLTTIINTARQLAPTPAEDLISYEAGIKSDLFGGRVRTNVTAFYLDYRSLSTGITGIECRNQPGATATFFNATAGTAAATAACSAFPGVSDPIAWNQSEGIGASVKGFEWEITVVPFDGLRFDWTGGYNKFKSSRTPPQGGALFAGNHRQSEWNMHANLSYDIESGFGTFTPRLDWSWQSQQDYDPLARQQAPEKLFIIPAYSLWNAQLAYKSPDRDWSATLTVSNLADKYYTYQVLRGAFATSTRAAPPRQWMLTVRKEF
jgi:iron complex outermembrane recepter protein